GSDVLLTLFDGEIREVDFSEPANLRIFEFGKQVMRLTGVSKQLERTQESSYRTDRDMTIGMMRSRIDSMRVEMEAYEAAVADPAQLSTATGISSGLTPEQARGLVKPDSSIAGDSAAARPPPPVD